MSRTCTVYLAAMDELFSKPIMRYSSTRGTSPTRPGITNAYFLMYRSRMRLSKTDLARLVGVDPKTIYNIEKGLVEPKVFLAIKIAIVLGVKVEDIFKIRTL